MTIQEWLDDAEGLQSSLDSTFDRASTVDRLNMDKAPFPWFGGKSRAAPQVWTLLGDVAHYVEPFCGSMAVLLNRPHLANRPYMSETVNDADERTALGVTTLPGRRRHAGRTRTARPVV